MSTQIKVWEIENGKLVARDDAQFSESHKEGELENWIERNPEILGENLLIIARQLSVPAGRIDLLGMDQSGKLVIIELKRNQLPREAVAQGLDYASWLSNASEEEIAAYAKQYLKQSLAEAFEDKFGTELPEWVCENHRVQLVAAGLDASAERIINYLAQKQIGINAAFFSYCELSGKRQILVRSVLVPESVKTPGNGTAAEVTEEDLMAMAKDRKTMDIVKTCRQMRDVWLERSENTAKGSFRYWTNPRMMKQHSGNVMVYGLNTSGELADAPTGQVDVWLNIPQLAEASGLPEAKLKGKLSKHFQPSTAGKMKFVLRIKNNKEAELFVRLLREVVTEQQKHVAEHA